MKQKFPVYQNWAPEKQKSNQKKQPVCRFGNDTSKGKKNAVHRGSCSPPTKEDGDLISLEKPVKETVVTVHFLGKARGNEEDDAARSSEKS